jgi:hypothetical protein
MAVSALFPAVFHRNSVPKKFRGIDIHYSAEKSVPFADFHMSRNSPLRGLERNVIPRKNVFFLNHPSLFLCPLMVLKEFSPMLA